MNMYIELMTDFHILHIFQYPEGERSSEIPAHLILRHKKDIEVH